MTAIMYSTPSCLGKKLRYFDKEIQLIRLIEGPQGANRAKKRRRFEEALAFTPRNMVRSIPQAVASEISNLNEKVIKLYTLNKSCWT